MSGDDCYEGKSLLTSVSTSKLGLPISNIITNWLESLPEEIILNILVRLPVKSLIRFTSVSKSWYSTVKDPKFIHTHLTHTLNSNDQNDTHLILIHNLHSKFYFAYHEHYFGFKEEDSFSLHYDTTASVTEYCKIEYPVAIEEEFAATKEELTKLCFRVVGTCNGLVLLSNDIDFDGCAFIVWNPSIRKYVTLPETSVRCSKEDLCSGPVGMGYDAVRNDYKVVRLTNFQKLPDRPGVYTLVEVYSVAEGSWSMVSPIECVVPTYDAVQVYINGALHWRAIEENPEMPHMVSFILTFDVASESLGKIMLPKGFELEGAPDFLLSVSGDRKSIAMFVKNGVSGDFFLEYWVMKEYSDEKSWTKLMVLGPNGPEINVPKVLCFRRNGELMLLLQVGDRIMLLKDSQIVSLDIVSKEFKHLGISGADRCSIHSYEESLVLLERKDAVSY